MERAVSHNTIIEYFESISESHKLINGFVRFNWEEIKSKLRSGVEDYILALESHSGDLEGNLISTFNNRTISFLVLGTVKAGDHDKMMEVYDTAEQIGLDIITKIKKDAVDDSRTSATRWLRGFDKNSVSYDSGGPLFVNKYGYNFILSLPNPEQLKFREEMWQ